ncbi:UPF0149 family protein [Methylomonas albis]|uniref:UPF0149 family protein n=1 Tax=Methylomonas albis TaxID=1854563 RepID=A0ABR9D6C5_9GAMM|nr:UPF0149 family protein [Methylomonas albis]MBD9358670.1 UPF0149 family protein [Methylomonas albis]
MIYNTALDNLLHSLDRCVEPALHLNKAGLNGFFHALTITPCIIDPSEWMAELFLGQKPKLTNSQVKNLKKAVIATVKASNKLLINNQLSFPYHFSELSNDALNEVWHWCYGFLRGINLRWSFWQSGIIANETGQTHDVVKASVNIITALVTEDVNFLDNLELLRSQLAAKHNAPPNDEYILAEVFQTLPSAYECLRIFAETMARRLQTYGATNTEAAR